MNMLEILLGSILGGCIAFSVIYRLGKRSIKTERDKLKAEIEALIHENQYWHPAIILERIQEFLK